MTFTVQEVTAKYAELAALCKGVHELVILVGEILIP